MTTTAIYDIETNGLLTEKRERDGSICPPLDRIHTVTIIWQEPGQPPQQISAANQPGYEKGSGRGWQRMSIVPALQLLETADVRVAHNGQDFDERAIPMVYPWFKPKPGSKLFDTLLLSRLIYPDIYRTGPNSHKLVGFEKGAHSLAAWGKRLGEHKGDYKGGWAEWSEDMQSYGEQDTVFLAKLFKWLIAQKPSPESVRLEHDFAAVIRRQEARGFAPRPSTSLRRSKPVRPILKRP